MVFVFDTISANVKNLMSERIVIARLIFVAQKTNILWRIKQKGFHSFATCGRDIPVGRCLVYFRLFTNQILPLTPIVLSACKFCHRCNSLQVYYKIRTFGGIFAMWRTRHSFENQNCLTNWLRFTLRE